MGVDQQRWDRWGTDIEAGKRQNPFYACPWCETCYWCVPLLCLQALLCLLNPCSWWLISKSNSGNNYAKNAINADIENEQRTSSSQTLRDVHYGWKSDVMGPVGVFYQGP